MNEQLEFMKSIALDCECLAECGGVEPPDYRERFFRRMYGQDFEPEELEKILKKIRES